MFDLSVHSYDNVMKFLEENIDKRDIKPCVPIELNDTSKDLYELIFISIDYEYYDDPNKYFEKHDVLYEKSYYYTLEYKDESFNNELSVINCGGYYIAVCIFKNKINVTNEYIYKKNLHGNNTFQKYHMNTIIGTKSEIISKNH